MMLEQIHPHFTFLDTYNAPDHIDSYVRKSIDDVGSNIFEIQDAIQKTQRNFDMVMNEVSRLQSDAFERDQRFERFIRSHFTPGTIASRVIERLGDNPPHHQLLLTIRWLLGDISSYSTGMFLPSDGSVVYTSKLLDILYAEYPSLLETVENKIEFFSVVIADTRNCDMLEFQDHDLFSNDMKSAFKKDFHAQIVHDPKRVVSHLLTLDWPTNVGNMVSDIISDTDTYLKFIDAVLDAEVSENQQEILRRLLRFVAKSIQHPNPDDENTDKLLCQFAGRVFRRPDAFDVFMSFHRDTREILRKKCPPLDNYLKVKFPHD